ncbi:nucleoplasmin-3 [Latimeria chalumnae]|uniref:nucleoplasmin-3 n=1 Tax=Latimeria chalumnae TaxID=7897 RepID=UPI00313B3263
MSDFIEDACVLEEEEKEKEQGRINMESFVFGCELSASVRSYTFKKDEEDESFHRLALRVACLGEGAKDEFNIVEIVALNHRNKEVAVPIVNLKLSSVPMVNLGDFELAPPLTIRLKSGSGPVSISGRHYIAHRDDLETDQSDEDSEEEEEEIIPIKPAKKKLSSF